METEWTTYDPDNIQIRYEYHAPTPDAKVKPRKLWCVTGVLPGEPKPVKISGTFDQKDGVLRAALRLVEAGGDKVKVWETELNWVEFEATSKADKEMWGKIYGVL